MVRRVIASTNSQNETKRCQPNSNIVTDGFFVARTGLGPFGEGWEEKGEDVDWFLYNRLWGVGVFTLIENIGLEPTEDVSLVAPLLASSLQGVAVGDAQVQSQARLSCFVVFVSETTSIWNPCQLRSHPGVISW